jgi:hypothetical protein
MCSHKIQSEVYLIEFSLHKNTLLSASNPVLKQFQQIRKAGPVAMMYASFPHSHIL